MENLNKKKIPTDSAVDANDSVEVTTEQVAADAALTPSDAKQIVDEAISTITSNEAKKDENLEASADSNKEVPGVKKVFSSSSSGVAKAIDPVQALSRSTLLSGDTRKTTSRTTAVSDLDKFAHAEYEAAEAYNDIQSSIDREATRVIEDGEDRIIGKAQENEVYSIQSISVEEEISGKNTFERIGSPKHRSIGTEFRRNFGMIVPSGDYVSGVHDAKKQFNNANGGVTYAGCYFNLLKTNREPVVGNGFVAPKIGKFWVRGFNPYPKVDAVALTNRGSTVRNDKVDTDEAVSANVYNADLGGANLMFDVVDLTAYVRNINNAAAFVQEQLIANKGRMRFGLYEALANQLQIVSNVMDNEEALGSKFPDYAVDRKRSTLWEGSRHTMGQHDRACYNEPETFFEMMEGIRNSDVMLLHAFAPLINKQSASLFFKGQTGDQSTDPYYADYSGMDPRQTKIGAHSTAGKNINLPNCVPFMRYLATPASFNTAGKMIYSFRALRTKLSAIERALKENETITGVLNGVSMLKIAVQELYDVLAAGRVTTEDGMTSNALVKLPGFVDMLIDIDPNDFIQYADGRWYPTCGYENLKNDIDVRKGVYKTYYVMPHWLDLLVKFYNTPETRKLFERDLTSSEDPSNATLKTWLNNGDGARRYIPIQINTMEMQLFGLILGEAVLKFTDVVIATNGNNALDRYKNVLRDFGFQELLNNYYDADAGAVATAMLGNDIFKVDPKWQKPAKFPMLYDSAREKFLDRDNVITSRAVIDLVVKGLDGNEKLYVTTGSVPIVDNMTNLHGFAIYDANDCDNDNAPKLLTKINDVDVKKIVSAEQLYEAIKTNAKTVSPDDQGDNFNIITNLIVRIGNVDEIEDFDEMTYAVKVPQFGVDEKAVGAISDVGAHLYGQDKHLITPCDFFVFAYEAGFDIDGCDTAKVNPRVMLLPCYVHGASKNVTEFSPVAVPHAPAPRSLVTDNLYEATDHICGNGVLDDGNSVYPTEERRNTISKLMCYPTLYGGKRLVPYGATMINPDYNGRLYDAPVKRSGSGTTPAIKDCDLSLIFRPYGGIHDDFTFMVVPYIQNLERNSSGVWSFEDAIASNLDGFNVNDARYYSRQHLFAGGVGLPTDYSGVGFDIQTAKEIGNYPIAGQIVDTGAAKSAGKFTQKLYARFDQFIKNYAGYRHVKALVRPHIDQVTTAARHATASSHLANALKACADDFTHSTLHTTDTFNDIRVFKIARPIKFLNKTWSNISVTDSLFAKQYLQD